MKRHALLIALCAVTTLVLANGCSQTPSPPTKGEGQPSGPAGFAQFSDVPIPTGASIKMDRSFIFGQHDAWIGRVVLSDWHNVGAMYDFYKGNTPKYGWEEITSVRSAVSVLTYTRGERVLTVQIQGGTLWGAEVDLTVSPRGTAAGAPGAQSSAMPGMGGGPPIGRAPTIPVGRSP